ncbi:MAG: ATP-binding cassette domain-containing protein [Halanaerobiaceae bacterium]
MLEIKNANLKLGNKEILRGLNLEFEEGKIYGILGHNGAGKSTIAYLLMGLENYKLDTGKIIFADEDITDLSLEERAQKGITLAWQEPSRYEGLTVEDFLTLGGRYQKGRAAELLEFVGLAPVKYLKREIDESLSGGERKRIEMASVMIINPDIVILDEPDSGIDYKSYQMVINVAQYLKEQGSIVIMITHNIDISEYLDYAYLICHGKVHLQGKPGIIEGFYSDRCDICEIIGEGSEDSDYKLQSGV